MLVIHGQLCAEAGLMAKAMFHRINRSIAKAFDDLLFAVIRISKNNLCIICTLVITDIFDSRFAEMQRLFGINIHTPEGVHNLFRRYFALNLGHGLNLIGQLFMHFFRKLEAIILFQNKGHAALAGLAVDSYQRFIFTAHIGWVNRQIRHFPNL